MLLIPLMYLKSGKAVHPVETNPDWFRDDPVALAHYFAEQGAKALYMNDLNVPLTGKGDNFSAIYSIQQKEKMQLWVGGNFRSLPTIEAYIALGIDKVVLGGTAYQDPNFLHEAAQKFPQKIAVQIEVKNDKVVIPGMVMPSHKSVLDYATQFENEGVSVLCYSEPGNKGLETFCKQVKIPILCFQELQNMQEIEKLFEYERSGLVGVVTGKSLYENRFDFHSAIAFLNDLEIGTDRENTL